MKWHWKQKDASQSFFIRADFDNQSSSFCLEKYFFPKSKPSKWNKVWNVVLFIICFRHFDKGLFSKPYYRVQMMIRAVLFCFCLAFFFILAVSISVWLFLFGFYRSRLEIPALFNSFNLFLLLCFNCSYSFCYHLLIIFFLRSLDSWWMELYTGRLLQLQY